MEKNLEAEVDWNSSSGLEGDFCTSMETILGSRMVTLLSLPKKDLYLTMKIFY